MFRLQPQEITITRIFSAIFRRISDVPDALAWAFPLKQTWENKSRLLAFSGTHTTRRCFIMANGPSLAKMDLSPLANEITFGLNRIYLLFDILRFQPTYFVCVNELVLEQFSRDIGALSMPKFLNWNRRRLFNSKNSSVNFVKLSLGLHDTFASEFDKPFSSGGTVTYVAIQIAYIMGFSEVILVGLDHSFVDKGIPNSIETRHAETDANHFHPNYFPKGAKWQLPDLRRSEIAYRLARNAFEKSGRRIVDATPGGHCPVFERTDYASLF